MSLYQLAIYGIFILVGCTRAPIADDARVASLLEDRLDQQVHWYQESDDESFSCFVKELLGQDLSPDSAVQIALLNNPELQAIFEEIGISRADFIQAGLFQNPAFDMVYRFPDRSGLKNNIEFSIVTCFLDIFLIPLRQKVAEAEWEQTQLRVANAALDLAFDVEKTFYHLQALQEQSLELKDLAELSELAHQLAKKQYELGNINILVLDAHAAESSEARIQLAQNELELIEHREKMTRLLGLCHSTQWTITQPLLEIPKQEFEGSCLENIALSERLDLQIARWEIYKIEQMFPLKHWWTYTNGQIGIGGEREPEGELVLGPALSLSLPFFNYGQADRARLSALYQQAQDHYSALEIKILSELHEALQLTCVNRELAAAYRDELLPLRERVLASTQKFYNVMTKSVFDLLEIKKLEIQTQMKASMALRDYWLARVDLDRALGGKLFLAPLIFNEDECALSNALAPEKTPAELPVQKFLPHDSTHLSYTPVITPNGSTLPWKMENGVKVFHLIAEPIKRQFAPGLIVNCWGYNGQSPGPTIEAVEGDRVRILVTNKLPEHTTVHWHGILLPNGMDGVTGLNQAPIPPGETFCYEFPLIQAGTHMYHPHYDEMTQTALGMVGFFIIHPKESEAEKIDRDFAIMLGEWFIPIGAVTPDHTSMDFNYFTFNSTVWPGTEPLVVKKGERVRIRFGNLSMDSHPIHLHGYQFTVTRKGASPLPRSAQYSAVTVNVPVGDTRDIEFVANAPGDWAMHCHKSHHNMSGMEHGLPNVLGVNQKEIAERIRKFIPHYMPMGRTGMGEMFSMPHHMKGPFNYMPLGSPGQFGTIEMSGMFTVLKVREGITNYKDPGWYHNPPGTVASPCKH